MSTIELNRSMLESKDKDELQTIASAMGGKPTSRARKSDLVSMILDLAGVGAANSSTPSGHANGDAAPEPAAAAPVASEAPLAPAIVSVAAFDPFDEVRSVATAPGVEPAGPAAVVEPAEEAPAEWELAVAAEDLVEDGTPDAATIAADTKQGGRGDSGQSDGGQRHAGQQGGGQQGGGQQGGGQQGGGQQGGGQQSRSNQGSQSAQGSQGGQGQQGGQGPDGEGDDDPSNRRRRRRGRRDRERERGGETTTSYDDQPQQQAEPVPVSGHLDLRDEGYGFLRVKGFLASKDDVYLSVKHVRQYGLRRGDHLTGLSRPAGRSEKNPALLRIDTVNGRPAIDGGYKRPRFEDLTPLFPDEKLPLERKDDPANMTCRIIDLIAPIGKGQRGLIVSPPKAGKTTIMKEIARSIEMNSPSVKLIVLLVDERPEEVTDMRRWLVRGEVVASTFDRPSDEHTHVAEMTIERAKRMVEEGEDVVIMLDGITRLARAYNLAAPATGRIMSGGVDSGALYPPKRFFGAARNVEEGGSLTILATALVETGSRMDEVIFEEFKGTGNMELRLDRRTAERRIYPAIDVDASSTRHEELLFERRQLQQVWKLRRVLSGLASDGEGGGAGLELLIDRLKTFPDNEAFLTEVAKGPGGV